MRRVRVSKFGGRILIWMSHAVVPFHSNSHFDVLCIGRRKLIITSHTSTHTRTHAHIPRVVELDKITLTCMTHSRPKPGDNARWKPIEPDGMLLGIIGGWGGWGWRGFRLGIWRWTALDADDIWCLCWHAYTHTHAQIHPRYIRIVKHKSYSRICAQFRAFCFSHGM